jgi:hypothetical protein
MWRLLPLVLVGALTACGGVTSTVVQPPGDPLAVTPHASCSMPLQSETDFEVCHDDSAKPFANEDVSVGGKSRHVWRFTIASKDPDQIVAALATQAQGMAIGVTEHTLFAFADEDTSGGFNRGRLVLGLDGTATFDICTEIETVTSQGTMFDVCGKQTTFSVSLR